MHCVGFEVRIPTPLAACEEEERGERKSVHPSVFSLEYSFGEEAAKTIQTADFSGERAEAVGGMKTETNSHLAPQCVCVCVSHQSTPSGRKVIDFGKSPFAVAAATQAKHGKTIISERERERERDAPLRV